MTKTLVRSRNGYYIVLQDENTDRRFELVTTFKSMLKAEAQVVVELENQIFIIVHFAYHTIDTVARTYKGITWGTAVIVTPAADGFLQVDDIKKFGMDDNLDIQLEKAAQRLWKEECIDVCDALEKENG